MCGGTGVVGQATPITTLQNVGTTLLITPNINADRTVTLRIQQENARVIPNGANIPIPNASGTGVTQVPIDTWRGRISRHSRGTRRPDDCDRRTDQEKLEDNRSQVPILGRIPYAGVFFRRQLTTRTRRELVILIRPFVLFTPCESRDAARR